jgi:hypothetical protein
LGDEFFGKVEVEIGCQHGRNDRKNRKNRKNDTDKKGFWGRFGWLISWG